jgi:hypothetical protein
VALHQIPFGGASRTRVRLVAPAHGSVSPEGTPGPRGPQVCKFRVLVAPSFHMAEFRADAFADILGGDFYTPGKPVHSRNRQARVRDRSEARTGRGTCCLGSQLRDGVRTGRGHQVRTWKVERARDSRPAKFLLFAPFRVARWRIVAPVGVENSVSLRLRTDRRRRRRPDVSQPCGLGSDASARAVVRKR